MKSKQQKRKEAIERAAYRGKLSPVDQIKHLDRAGYVATRERARLNKQIKEGSK